ncbi:hypothetical protein [Nocardia sp. NPDC052566]|uniref:hypothetical protein n=1 Tax=Nocardia sp. NPDC052566 TaxID=3364330 RepID=UPI0037C8C54A
MKFSIRRAGLVLIGAAAVAVLAPAPAFAQGGLPLEEASQPQPTQIQEGTEIGAPQTADEIRYYYCRQTSSLSGGRHWRCS